MMRVMFYAALIVAWLFLIFFSVAVVESCVEPFPDPPIVPSAKRYN
jgi:hypothetical protein